MAQTITSAGTDLGAAVTAYHLAQARTRRRREKAKETAPKRRAARDAKVAAMYEEANASYYYGRSVLLAEIEKKLDAERRMIENARDEKEAVRRRMSVGFELLKPTEIGGRIRQPFVEKGLRSDRLGVAGKLFVRGCRKGKNLRSGEERGLIYTRTGRKVLNLDYAYVEGNRRMVSLIRVDLDRYFDGFDDLRDRLQVLVVEGKLPCMPHLVVGDIQDLRRQDLHHATLVRPHLWFILRDAVAFRAPEHGGKGREGPKRLFNGVYRALVHALLPLGSDPDALVTLVRGKNPLSPFWHSESFNDTVFPSLTDYAKAMPEGMTFSREKLAREAAKIQSALPKAASNALFNTAAKQAWKILREMHAAGTAEYLDALDDREELRALLGELMPLDDVLALCEERVSDDQAAYVIDKVIGYASSSWKPVKAGQAEARANRHKLAHLVEGLDLKGRQAVAGRASGAAKKDAAREAVIAAMVSVRYAGGPWTRVEVARVAGLDRSTVSRHWRSCEIECDNRCLDKKGSLLTDNSVVSDLEEEDVVRIGPKPYVSPAKRDTENTIARPAAAVAANRKPGPPPPPSCRPAADVVSEIRVSVTPRRMAETAPGRAKTDNRGPRTISAPKPAQRVKSAVKTPKYDKAMEAMSPETQAYDARLAEFNISFRGWIEGGKQGPRPVHPRPF